jgi:hypothetical protein
VSASEIIKELPTLTESDRRAIPDALLGIASQNLEIALCNESALEAALMLDRMEEAESP